MIIRISLLILLLLLTCSKLWAEPWPSADFKTLNEEQRFVLLSGQLHDHERVCDAAHATRLMAIAGDESYRVRNVAVLLLARCRESGRAQEIAQLLVDIIKNGDERSIVRSDAIAAIGGMGKITPEIRSTLKQYAMNANTRVRREDAMLSWADYGVADDELFSLVYQRLTAKRKSTCIVAARSLQLLAEDLKKHPTKLNTTLAFIDKRLPSGQLNFDQALVVLVGELLPASEGLIDNLLLTLEQSPFTRKDVAVVLPQFGETAKQALPLLYNLVNESTGFERSTLLTVIKKIEAL